MRSTVVTYDKPGFTATSALIKGKTVCILHPATATDARFQERARRLMQGRGIDCRSCGACPVGRAQ
ncbi:hypothetical protein [Streptomyces sp. bgisy034]|uniref:hypothetical protein n=1 Tax=Streptomyces sp. bgisy034 TaxID=3413774 RepID=UPI003EBA33FD